MHETKLIFRTEAGGVVIPSESSVNLTKNIPYTTGLVVKHYPAIRLACSSRNASHSPVTIKLIFTEGRELTTSLDTITLQPGETFTSVYPIPGTALTIIASAGTGDAYIDLFVYASTTICECFDC